MKGDFYQCIKCDKWSIDRENKTKCVNKNCPSNIPKSFYNSKAKIIHPKPPKFPPMKKGNAYKQ